MTPSQKQAQQQKAAKDFVAYWKAAEGNEKSESNPFWIQLFENVLGVPNPTRVLEFERKVKGRFMDIFLEDVGVLIENKSRGVNLDDKELRGKNKDGSPRYETPFEQAKWYADNITPRHITPRWIVLCNFDEFRIHDLDREDAEINYERLLLEELPDKLHYLSFLTSKENSRIEHEKELSVAAGEVVGRLYDAIATRYRDLKRDADEQRSLNILITRLVFLFYAENAGLFDKNLAFHDWLQTIPVERTNAALEDLFKVLNTPENERSPYLGINLKRFPYVNGGLFKDKITVPDFDAKTREILLKEASAGFNWKDISPTIFGSVFESTLNPATRRAGGMHYTSVQNIHKVIDPLFMDDLWRELRQIEGYKSEDKRKFLFDAFRKKIASLRIFDPACGSGNFLTETYLSLRKLENRVLQNLHGSQMAFAETDPIQVGIHQFYGIEINDFAVEVAKTALWIAEIQMLAQTREILNMWIEPLPLKDNAYIHCGNALRMDWNTVIPAEQCSYIIGNPPFVGFKFASKEQKDDLHAIVGKEAKLLDYVCGWYFKTAAYMQETACEAALVSTNSVSQGKMAADLWSELQSKYPVSINFAHRSFVWDSEASDKAHVHCVIIGFAANPRKQKYIYAGETSLPATNINCYLLDFPDVYIGSRTKPLCDVPEMVMGNQAMDGGNLIIEAEEYNAFVRSEPRALPFIKRYMMGNEFINGKERWCLWLAEIDENTINSMPLVRERVERVRSMRAASNDPGARKKSETPHLFREQRNPDKFVAIPIVSSERRDYVPMGYLGADVIAGNKLFILENASLYHFGVLVSQFHNTWMRTVGARLEMRYTYSKDIVYNNFPWPDADEANHATIEKTAQAILDARANHPDRTLAEMYDGISPMPENPSKSDLEKFDRPEFNDLKQAHAALDAAVEAAYGVDFGGDEEKIVAHLFKLYAKATQKTGK